MSRIKNEILILYFVFINYYIANAIFFVFLVFSLASRPFSSVNGRQSGICRYITKFENCRNLKLALFYYVHFWYLLFLMQCNLPKSYITALEIFWRKKEKPWRLDEIYYDVQVWNIYLLQSCYVGVLESFAFTVWSIWYNMFFEHINPSYLLSLPPFSYESK